MRSFMYDGTTPSMFYVLTLYSMVRFGGRSAFSCFVNLLKFARRQRSTAVNCTNLYYCQLPSLPRPESTTRVGYSTYLLTTPTFLETPYNATRYSTIMYKAGSSEERTPTGKRTGFFYTGFLTRM